MLAIRAVAVRKIWDTSPWLDLEVFFTLGTLSPKAAFFISFNIHRESFHFLLHHFLLCHRHSNTDPPTPT